MNEKNGYWHSQQENEPCREETPDEVLRLVRKKCNRTGVALISYVAACYVWLFIIIIVILVLALTGKTLFWRLISNTVFQSVLSDVAVYGGGAFVFWLILRKMPEEKPVPCGTTPAEFLKWTIESIALMFGLGYISTMLVELLPSIFNFETYNALDSLSDMPAGAAFLLTVILAPVFEEYIFRRMLLRRLHTMGQSVAVVMSAVIFGLFHCNLNQFFYATGTGLLFGMIAAETGRIRYTVFLHAIINFCGGVLPNLLSDYTLVYNIYYTVIFLVVIAGFTVLALDMRQRGRYRDPMTVPTGPGVMKAALTAPGTVISWGILLIISIINVI